MRGIGIVLSSEIRFLIALNRSQLRLN